VIFEALYLKKQGDETMDNNILSVVLWVGAAVVLVLLIMRRRKRKLQS
jgi:hypothetical protein